MSPHLAKLCSRHVMKLSFENQHKMREPFVLALGVVLGLFAERLRQRASQRRPPIRAPGFKPWRMSKWVRYNGVVETQGLCGDPKATNFTDDLRILCFSKKSLISKASTPSTTTAFFALRERRFLIEVTSLEKS